LSEPTQQFVAPVHLQTGSWWAASEGNARRTALGTTAVALVLAMITWLIWVSPGDNAVRTAVQQAVGGPAASTVSTLKADRSALLDQLLSAERQLSESKASLAEVQQQNWSNEAALTEAEAQLASARAAVRSAEQAAGTGSGGTGPGGAGAASGSGSAGRGDGQGSGSGSGSGSVSDDGSGDGSGSGGGAGAGDGQGPVGPAPVTAPPLSEILAADSTDRLYGLYTEQAPFNWSTYDSITEKVGAETNMVGFFQGFDQDFRPDAVQRAWSEGRLPVLTWESQPLRSGNDAVDQPDYSLSHIVDGDFDEYLTRYADDIVANGLPLGLRFDHEMNGAWYPWSTGVNGNEEGEYVAAWQHVHDLFEARGANEYVAWIWAPSRVDRLGAKHTAEYLEQFWPGPEYVDWVGMTGYYRPPYDERSKPTFESTFAKTIDQLRTVAPGKEILLAEVGASESGGSVSSPGEKARWMSSLFDALGSGEYDDVIGFGYFNLVATTIVADGDGKTRTTNDWRLDSRADSLEAFRVGIRRTDTGFSLDPTS